MSSSVSQSVRGILASASISFSILSLGCGGVAHDFVASKTGIDVGPEVRLCSNGVLHDDSSCRPNGTGGMPWVKNENFDIYPVSGANGWSDIVSLAGQRYLGAPYWRGHLQPACKVDIGRDPAVLIAADTINLAAKLDEEINRRFFVDAAASLRKAGVPLDARAEFAFRDALRRLVDQKMRVELVWFVATYTGGRYAVERSQAFGRCREEVQSHANDGAQFVTGVAGFAVLANHADVSINSSETVAEALGIALRGPTPVVDGEIASSWEKTVGKVIHVDASTNAVTQTVYPLWVQFE
jgi:hypothetical protein